MKKYILSFITVLFLSSVIYCQSDDIHSLPQENTVKSVIHKDFNKLKIRFSFTEEISSSPLSGRIILGFNSDTSKSVNGPDLMNNQPAFAWDVSDWKAGEYIVLDGSSALCWKGCLDSLDGWYGVQAALKTNRKARTLKAFGNCVTRKFNVYIEKGRMSEPLDLVFSIPFRGVKKFKESEFVKEVSILSMLMTQFFGEPDSIKAAVVLPESYYTDTVKKYPVVYVFGGWGSSHYDVLSGFPQKRYGMSDYEGEKIFVYVNHECRTGYHSFCTSETNGPREETFISELMPYVENNFRVIKKPQARFLMGQSSGGWAALWLLINYPDEFGGAFAGSPDPVDFRDFTGTDIYSRNANMMYDGSGKEKYLINTSDTSLPKVTMKEFIAIDIISGWGEQVYSFDAAYSSKGTDGEPLHLFDWNSGKVNPEVAMQWADKDLSKKVLKLDAEKINLLQGKIHVYTAENDPFGLDNPVKLFRKVLEERGLNADIRILPDGGHLIWTDELRKSIHEEIDKVVQSVKGD